MTNAKTRKKQRTFLMQCVIFIILCIAAVIVVLNCSIDRENEQNDTTETTYGRCTISQNEREMTTLWLASAEENISCNSEPIVVISEMVEEEEEFLDSIITISTEEYELLCKLVFAESTRQSENEMISIAATVINRIESDQFPDDISSVIFDEDQFSTANEGKIYWFPEANKKAVVRQEDITEEVKSAVDIALTGYDPTEVMVQGGTLFFYSDRYISVEERQKRENIHEQIKFGDTIFYHEYGN